MKFIKYSLLLLTVAVSFHSCVKQKFDEPTDNSYVDPKLPVDASIKMINQSCLSLPSSYGFRQMGDTTISGIVVADDRSGNFYKKIIIQDTSGVGIQIMIDKTNLYGDYPVGRRIYLKTSGLYLVNYAGTTEICYDASVDGTGRTNTESIPSAVLDNYIVKGNINNTEIQPVTVSIADINGNVNKYMNALVRLEGVQFRSGSNNIRYADFQSSGTDRTIENCGRNQSIVARTSGYSDFQPALTPNGNGTMLAIVTYYSFKSVVQLVIRDTADVQMTNARCN
jgi:hypothetical protein